LDPVSARIIVADVLDGLATLEPESVQCVVTSPPYWGLRDYGVPGQLGLEATPREYLRAMRRVFRAVRRVLKPDGTLWLNMGDCYNSGTSVPSKPGNGAVGGWRNSDRVGRRRVNGRGVHTPDNSGKASPRIQAMGPMTQPNRMPIPGLKPKDLMGMPWRLALALQRRGWWLRSDIVWQKPNPMPESVTDRPTRSHEYLFLMARSSRYYYDADAIREPQITDYNGDGRHPIPPMHGAQPSRAGLSRPEYDDRKWSDRSDGRSRPPMTMVDRDYDPRGRNKRTVWTIPTQPFPEAHFATFPEDLVEPCILAGSRRGDLILDPFAGSGTVGLVADRLGRDFVGVELNPAYAALAERRLREDSPLFADAELTQGDS
jgi:DNA modification methylase